MNEDKPVALMNIDLRVGCLDQCQFGDKNDSTEATRYARPESKQSFMRTGSMT